jgi:flagellar hook-associated protein 2
MISSPGIGSGIDINSIINELVAARKAERIDKLEVKKATSETQLSTNAQIKTLMENFQNSAQSVNSLASADFFKVTSSNDDKLSAAMKGSNASQGSHDIIVTQLASAHKIASTNFAAKDTSIGATGTIQIQKGSESFQVAIGSGSDNLVSIRDAINNASDNTGVSAAILSTNSGGGAAEYRLVLTSNDTGASNAITVTDVSGSVASTLNITAGTATEIEAAQDALFSVDGFSAQRASNVIDDVLEGVEFTLKTDDGSTNTLNITNDNVARDDAVKEKLQNFVDNFNKLVDFIDKEAATAESATFNNLNFVRSQIRGEISSSNPSSSTVSTLAEIGVTTLGQQSITDEDDITFESSGRLSLDTTKLTSALDNDFNDVVDMLTNTSTGIMQNVSNKVEEFVKFDGILDIREDALNSQIRTFDTTLAREESLLDSYELSLIQQYAALDALVSQFQSTSNFLTQQLAILPGTSSK